MTRTCGPSGMPRVMTLYVAMEIVIRPNTTYILFESTSPIRRIYTDGRAWPKEFNPQFSGYSIGKWLDTTGEHSTTFDHALVRPWTVSRFYRRGLNPVYEEYPCTEDNHWVAVGDELYLSDSEGYLMPIQKNQPPPDSKFFQKYFQTKQ